MRVLTCQGPYSSWKDEVKVTQPGKLSCYRSHLADQNTGQCTGQQTSITVATAGAPLHCWYRVPKKLFVPVCFWFEDIFLLNWVIFQKKTHFGQNEGVQVPVTLIRTHHMKALCPLLVLKGQNVFCLSQKVMRVSFKNLWELSILNHWVFDLFLFGM